MSVQDAEYPRLRPLEAIPDPDNGRIVLRDPTQLAAGMLVVGEIQFTLLTLLDGSRRRAEIQSAFSRRFGHPLLSHELEHLLGQLDRGGFLEGPGFDAYYGRLEAEYEALPYRPLRDPDDFGAPAAELPAFLDGILADAPRMAPTGALRGLVVPHLDFERGGPCYGAGYRMLRDSGFRPERVVILGTNHFGRSESPVATWKDWETPWGVLPTDRELLERLEARAGGSLRRYELDHLREHSIELQAVWLHHLFPEGVHVLAILCPDPSGPRGTAPGDPGAVDVRALALALRAALREDPTPTLLLASADLSHVGGYFGDRASLTDGRLAQVRRTDAAGLELIERNDPEAYRQHMRRTGNPTRVCSVGCLFALMTALGPDARATRLEYHQAVTSELDNAVTCAALAFTGSPG